MYNLKFVPDVSNVALNFLFAWVYNPSMVLVRMHMDSPLYKTVWAKCLL